MRFAIVGCGTAAEHIHLPGLGDAGVDVTAFTSRSPASAERLRDLWGRGAVVERWAEAVERDDVDAVLVTTPNAHHADVGIAALRAGKHVLVDKPMAASVAECDAMIAAAEEAGRVLVPFQNTRFAAPFWAAHECVAEERIGDVTGVRAAFGHGGPQHWAPHATWFFERTASGGGCLVDLGVHVIDLVRFATGHDIVAVSALLNGRAGDVETDAQLVVRLDNDAVGSVHASWSSCPGSDHQLTIIGSEGTLHLDDRTPLTLLTADGSRDRVRLPASTSSPLVEFIAAAGGEREPSVSGADGRAAVAVVEAAYRSVASGGVERVA